MKKRRLSLTHLNWQRWIVIFVLAIASISTTVSILLTGILPNKFIIVLGTTMISIFSLAAYAWIRPPKSRVLRRVGIGLTVLYLIGCIAILHYAQTTNKLITQSASPERAHRISYYVIGHKNHSVTLSPTVSLTIGTLTSDRAQTEALSTARAHAIFTPQPYRNLTEISLALTDQSVQTILLNDATYQLLKESKAKITEPFVVLKTFEIETPKAVSKITDTTQPFTVFVSGIDTYGSINAVARSDVNIIAVINPRSHRVLLINTPRDYYVQLHGTDGLPDKLTHAGIYGTDMSVATLKDLYRVEIDRSIRINFSSLVSLVDRLGGITVYSDYAFKGFQAGDNHLNGEQTLMFSRERYSFAEGDRMRGKNQQKVITAIIEKLISPRTLISYPQIVSTLEGSYQTNFSRYEITSFFNRQLDTMKPWAITSISVNGQGSMAPTYSMGSQPLYVMIPDELSLAEARQTIAETLKP